MGIGKDIFRLGWNQTWISIYMVDFDRFGDSTSSADLVMQTSIRIAAATTIFAQDTSMLHCS